MMSRRRWTAALAGVAAVGAFLLYATHDRSGRQPETSEMEALVGAPLAGPVYQSSSLVGRWRATARSSWVHYALPVPNQMAFRSEGDVWTYSFAADSSYSPPPGSALGPSGSGWVAARSGGWRYHVWVDPAEGGILVARLLP